MQQQHIELLCDEQLQLFEHLQLQLCRFEFEFQFVILARGGTSSTDALVTEAVRRARFPGRGHGKRGAIPMTKGC